MLFFAVPFNSKNIEQPFIKAFENMTCILARHQVELVMIDCRFGDQEHLKKKVQSIVSWIDGIIFPGNPYSIDPRIYGESPLHPERVDPEPKNFEFVKLMIEVAEVKGIPILGICAGSWYLNVVRGGTLQQDVTHFVHSGEKHDLDPRDGRIAHEIKVLPDTRLFNLFKSERAKVNSWHDQSIGKLGDGLRVSAISPDGVPEAIEGDGDSFFVGIQFHPEYLLKGDITDGYVSPKEIAKQHGIFEKMAEAASQRAQVTPMSEKDKRVQARALVFHQANTLELINEVKHRGKFQIR